MKTAFSNHDIPRLDAGHDRNLVASHRAEPNFTFYELPRLCRVHDVHHGAVTDVLHGASRDHRRRWVTLRAAEKRLGIQGARS